ncbi:MAG: MFS transporter [Telluria sp.]
MTRTAIAAGTPEFRRINRAMLFGGFSTFALLYCVQPMMPMFAQAFGLSPARASLVLSVSSAALAVSLLAASVLSDRLGRKGLMGAAMLGAGVLTLLCAVARDFNQLLVLRALMGIALGGMPAAAMAYLSEEIEGSSLGLCMGLYVAGCAFGGMLGRFIVSVIGDFFGWRMSLAAMGVAGLYSAFEFWRALPASRNFRPHRANLAGIVASARAHLADEGLPWLFVLSFTLMGCFVSLYNYIGYRLLAAPYALRPSIVGAFSVLYLIGIFSSVWAGRLADRIGRRNVLWLVMSLMLVGLLVTLAGSLWFIALGIGLFTFGFFASHSVASSWVGMRARGAQALASAMYLFFYYVGSSVIGSFSGVLWARHGWNGVVAVLGLGLAGAFAIALRLRGLQPLPAAAVTAPSGTPPGPQPRSA